MLLIYILGTILISVLILLTLQLISHLHNLVLKGDETGNPIETKLRQVSQELNSVIKSYVKDIVERMVRSAQDKCPNVLNDEVVVDSIRSTCFTKAQLSEEIVEEAIVEQAGSVILNKVNEISLNLASTVSDRVIDEVVDSLSKTCKSLQCGGDGPRKRASTGTEMSSCMSSESSTRSERSADLQSQAEDSHSHKSDPSPLATPQLPSKRKGLHGRKLRPQSVVASESLDSVSELPSSCGQLQHMGKARPRRTKTRAPTRPMGRAEVLEEDHDISHGVDNFFSPGSATPTTPLVSPESENSPHFLLKYGSTSSMDSGPHAAGRPSSSDKGSVESLTASEPLVRSASDIMKRRSKDTDDELCIDLNDEERRSVSSLIGKLGVDPALKLSPDLISRKATSLYEASEEEDTASKRLSSGFQKYGRAIGGNVLAEMKARQKKTSSPKEEEKDINSCSGLISGVRLRATGLKSPNGFSRNSTKEPHCDSFESSPAIGIKPSTCKHKLPPPLAPKPRPKSAFSPDLKPDYDVVDAVDDGSQRSVKELAASLASKGVVTASDDLTLWKSSSLPRNSNADEPTIYSGGQSKALSGQGRILSAHQMEELEETSIDGESNDDKQNLHRQTSQKHVVTSNVTIDDVIDV